MRQSSEKLSLSNRAEYCAVRFLHSLCMALPIDWASAIMGRLWRVFAPFNSRHKRVLRHLEWAFGDKYSEREREQIARNMWENLGRTFMEGIVLEKFLQAKDRFDVKTPAFLEGWTQAKDGAIIATHHFGNWELASTTTVLFSDKKLLGLYKRVKNRLVERFFLTIRANAYPGGLYSAQSHGAKRTVEYIRSGGDMAMVADLRDNNGIKINFFNMPMSVTTFPASLARKFEKPLYAAQMRRTNGANFKLDMVEIPVDRTPDLAQDIFNTTQRVHRQFEDWIRKDPEQFMWGPYRWSGRLSELEKPMSWHDFCEK